MNVERVLRSIREELGREPLFLAGAFALQAYGIARMTADLDLVVGMATQERLIAAMEEMGFETLYRSEGFSNHVHRDPQLGRVDFIYVEPRTQELLAGGAAERSLGANLAVLVPKPEHLIAMKVHAIRNDPSRRLQDLADIQKLLGVPGVDRAGVRKLFERAGLKEAWDELDG